MRDACLLVPIHTPKFKYGIDFLNSYNKYYDDDHVFLVFSTSEESISFAELATGLRYRSIISPPLQGASPTTEKKWNGLLWIYANTDFVNVGVVDIDTLFIKHIDYAELFHKYNQRGILYGNNYEYAPGPMITSPLKFFDTFNQGRLYELVHEFKTYFWFNDLPVYNKQYFLEFTNHINYPARAKDLVWFDFDFVPYAYYLLLTRRFKLEIITVDGAPLNAIFIEDQKLISPAVFERVFAVCKPMWVQQDVDPSLMSQTFMRVHVDR